MGRGGIPSTPCARLLFDPSSNVGVGIDSTAGLQFNKDGFDQERKYVVICMQLGNWIQTCKTGDQPYLNTSQKGDYTLISILSQRTASF